MIPYCDICDRQAVSRVAVSVASAGDQTRNLYDACEEAYTWGIQHARFTIMDVLVHKAGLTSSRILDTVEDAPITDTEPIDTW